MRISNIKLPLFKYAQNGFESHFCTKETFLKEFYVESLMKNEVRFSMEIRQFIEKKILLDIQVLNLLFGRIQKTNLINSTLFHKITKKL